MAGKVKAFFSFLVSHWILTLLFVVGVVVFLAPMILRGYAKVRAKLTFLPAPKV